MQIDAQNRKVKIQGKIFGPDDYLSLDGTTGEVLEGAVPTQEPEPDKNFKKLMALVVSLPTGVPLTRNSTWASASSSVASALSSIVPLTVLPSAGLVRLTVGLVVSGLLIVTPAAALVAQSPYQT